MAPNFTENYDYPELESKAESRKRRFSDLLDIYPAKKDIFPGFPALSPRKLKSA